MGPGRHVISGIEVHSEYFVITTHGQDFIPRCFLETRTFQTQYKSFKTYDRLTRTFVSTWILTTFTSWKLKSNKTLTWDTVLSSGMVNNLVKMTSDRDRSVQGQLVCFLQNFSMPFPVTPFRPSSRQRGRMHSKTNVFNWKQLPGSYIWIWSFLESSIFYYWYSWFISSHQFFITRGAPKPQWLKLISLPHWLGSWNLSKWKHYWSADYCRNKTHF